jgi:hypothetical protein
MVDLRRSGLSRLSSGSWSKRGLITTACVVTVLAAGRVGVWAADAASAGSAQALVTKMLAVEDAEAARKGRYIYLSKERSERTGERLWTEWVAETSAGKIRRLVAEDGQPLSGDRAGGDSGRSGGLPQEVAGGEG